MKLRLPAIDGASDSVKIAKIQEFLYELTNQLNFALLDIERDKVEVVSYGATTASAKKESTPAQLFDTLKPFIIKNADIIASYSEEISKVLKGEYVAKTDYAEYVKKTEATFEATSENISQTYTRVEGIYGTFEPGVDTAIVKTTNAVITTGFLGEENGNAQYGMQITTISDNKKFASAKFLSTGVIIYDEMGKEALIITDETINVKNVSVSKSFALGGLRTTVVGAVITGKYLG